jgi:hypothetical protein
VLGEARRRPLKGRPRRAHRDEAWRRQTRHCAPTLVHTVLRARRRAPVAALRRRDGLAVASGHWLPGAGAKHRGRRAAPSRGVRQVYHGGRPGRAARARCHGAMLGVRYGVGGTDALTSGMRRAPSHHDQVNPHAKRHLRHVTPGAAGPPSQPPADGTVGSAQRPVRGSIPPPAPLRRFGCDVLPRGIASHMVLQRAGSAVSDLAVPPPFDLGPDTALEWRRRRRGAEARRATAAEPGPSSISDTSASGTAPRAPSDVPQLFGHYCETPRLQRGRFANSAAPEVRKVLVMSQAADGLRVCRPARIRRCWEAHKVTRLVPMDATPCWLTITCASLSRQTYALRTYGLLLDERAEAEQLRAAAAEARWFTSLDARERAAGPSGPEATASTSTAAPVAEAAIAERQTLDAAGPAGTRPAARRGAPVPTGALWLCEAVTADTWGHRRHQEWRTCGWGAQPTGVHTLSRAPVCCRRARVRDTHVPRPGSPGLVARPGCHGRPGTPRSDAAHGATYGVEAEVQPPDTRACLSRLPACAWPPWRPCPTHP